MSIVLCSREDEQKVLSHGLVLCTEEEADFLMHYRTKGSVNGIRRYQYEDGSLTPEGYRHYGIGQGNRHARNAEKYAQKAGRAENAYEKAAMKYEKTIAKAERTRNPDRAKKLTDKANAQQHKVNVARLNMDKWKERTENANRKAEEQEKRGMERIERESENKSPSRMESFRSALETGHNIVGDILGGIERRDRERSEKRFVDNVEKFDKLSTHDQKVVGDEVLNRVADFDNHSDSNISSEQAETLRSWLFNRIDRRSGNWNTGDSVSEGHKKAMDKLNEAGEKLADRIEQIKDEIDFDDPKRYSEKHPFLSLFMDSDDSYFKKEAKRLKNAMNSDRMYKALKEATSAAEKDLCGAVLKDIGLSDSPENRALIFQYVFVD